MTAWSRSGAGAGAAEPHSALFVRAREVQRELEEVRLETFRSAPVPFVPKPPPAGWSEGLSEEIEAEFAELSEREAEVFEAYATLAASQQHRAQERRARERAASPGRVFIVVSEASPVEQPRAVVDLESLRGKATEWSVRHAKSMTEPSKMSPAELAERTGLKLATIYARLQAGKSPAEIVATPLRQTGASFDGRRFGRLTVVRQSERRTAAGKRIFVCRCDCGTDEKEIIGADLVSGRTVSCGCNFREKSRARALARAEDITGQRFARLLVIGVAGWSNKTNGSRIRKWDCLCDCGNRVACLASNLRAGFSTSCGCKHAENLLDAIERNKARAIRVDVLGEDLTLEDAAQISGLTKNALRDRMKRGMSPSDAVTMPRTRAPAKCRRCGGKRHITRPCPTAEA